MSSTCDSPRDVSTPENNQSDTSGLQGYGSTVTAQEFKSAFREMSASMQNGQAQSLVEACPLSIDGVENGNGSTPNSPGNHSTEGVAGTIDTKIGNSPNLAAVEGAGMKLGDLLKVSESSKSSGLLDTRKIPFPPGDFPPNEESPPIDASPSPGPIDRIPILPMSNERIDQRAEDVVSRILKSNDFGSPETRKEIQRFMEEAARTGQMPDLADAINKMLKDKGSDIELHLESQSRTDILQECNSSYRHDAHTVNLSKGGEYQDQIHFTSSQSVAPSPCEWKQPRKEKPISR